jgi:hypothetical protein
MKVLLSLLLVLLASSPGAADSTLVEASPVVIDSRDEEQKNFGSFRLLSALQLRSRDKRFGGLSGIAVTANNRLYAVSDRGHWFSARMILNTDGVLVNLVEWQINNLLAADKAPVKGALSDSEALARGPDGSFFVAFENSHRVWRYPPPPAHLTSPPVTVPVPAELAAAPSNGGLECIAVLRDGQIVGLTEDFANSDGSLKGWLIQEGRFHEVSYLPSDGFRVSDCVAIAGGDIIVLERSHTFLRLRGRLKLISAANLRPGAKLVGKELLRLEPPLVAENFEALTVQENPHHGTVIYVVSDDNFHPLQRTLILQFRWDRNQQ